MWLNLGHREHKPERLVAVIQNFFCDEGGKYKSGPIVSFVGLIVSPSSLEKFDTEWDLLLRSYDLDSLHMKKVADIYSAYGSRFLKNRTIQTTIEFLEPFADCINKYMEVGLMELWDVAGYAGMATEAKKRLGGSHNDPHYLAFVRGILEVAHKLQPKDCVNLYCDDDEIKAWDCYLHYRAVCKAMPELKDKFAALTFADDRKYAALQAADMVAFLSRLQAQARFNNSSNPWKDFFFYLTTDPKPSVGSMRWFVTFADTEKLTAISNELSKPLVKK
jgi:Protein of unknown function (DUF3800)